MSRTGRPAQALEAKQRVEEGLEALRVWLVPYVARHMRDRHGPNWRHDANRAHRDEPGGELDVHVLLKTLLNQRNDLFRHDAKLRTAPFLRSTLGGFERLERWCVHYRALVESLT